MCDGQLRDLIDMLHERLGSVTLKDALTMAQSVFGDAPCPTAPRESRWSVLPNTAYLKASRGRGRSSPRASRCLAICLPPICRGVGSRGLVRLLRYHMRVFLQHSEDDPDPPQWAPAPLARITDNRGQVAGCARTFLDPSTGSLAAIKIPKRILGQAHGHAICF